MGWGSVLKAPRLLCAVQSPLARPLPFATRRNGVSAALSAAPHLAPRPSEAVRHEDGLLGNVDDAAARAD